MGVLNVEELEKKATEWIRSQGWSEENLPNDEYIEMCDAYVAGAKENQPTVEEMLKLLVKGGYVKSGIRDNKEDVFWHDLRKNPNDLPKDENFKLCISTRGGCYIAKYEEIIGTWTNQEYKEVCCPYAWKEIVPPKESE